MPLIVKILNKTQIICVWELTESEDELVKTVNKQKIPFLHLTQNIKFSSKRKERLAALLCINAVLGKNIYYELGENGKPFLKNSTQHISISNCENRVAILFSNNNSCGIDYQKKTNQLLRILSKFANENEIKTITNFVTPLNLTHWLWCAKEAIYKKHNIKGLSFKNDINLKEITNLQHKIILTFNVTLNKQIIIEKTDCTLLKDFYVAYTIY